MLKKTVVILFLLVAFASCDYFESKKTEDKVKIAKVNEFFMYKDDLDALMPQHYAQKDSLLIVKNIINNWAKRQLLIYNAKLNLGDDMKDIDALVDKYKQDLWINKYREAVVSQNLDTLVSTLDVDEFYKSKKEILMLNEGLVQLKFIQLSKDIINLKDIIKRFKSGKQEDVDVLLKDEMAYKSLHFNDSIWIKYSDVIKFIPVLK